ncbi:MAG: B12-binding domain-containing radical SAM protein [Clostridia bacterium]|nr:B12-binding domain-containing radical SAM protein [Clostridia bacterium]
MRVLLTTLNAKYIHVNLALRYLKAYCQDLPLCLELEEFTINDYPSQIAAAIYQRQPDLVAFSCYIWNLEATLRVIEILKTVKPELTLLCGGPEVSFDTAAFLAQNPTVDMVICGEGELPFRTLLEQLAAGNFTPASIPSLAYRQGGTVRVNPPAEPLKQLDRLPFPYAADLSGNRQELQQRTVYYECSRGCPFACSFCLSSTEKGLRYFSLERIKDDLTRLLAGGVREIKFVDRTFNAHKKRALAIWEFLVSLKPAARFYFEIAADHLDEELLAFLNRVPPGLFQLEIGVQTIDAAVNLRCNRRQNWQRLAKNIRRLQQGGNLRLHLDLIAGLPGEDYAGIAKSFDAVAALQPEEIQLGFLKLLKGTAIREQADEFGYLFVDRPPYEVLASKTISYAEMLRLHRIESLIKYYGNSHLADHALSYLVATAFGGSYFAFYETLADWWQKQGLLRQGHSQRKLYNHLANFAASLVAAEQKNSPNSRTGYTSLNAARLAFFYQLLKFDFLCRDRSHNWPDWVPPSPLTKAERSACMAELTAPEVIAKYMPELTTESPTNLRRHSFIELFPCHPDNPQQDKPTLAFFYYGPPGRQPEVYCLSPALVTSFRRHY